MALVILIMPILLAIGITFFAPGLSDTTVNLAMLENDDPAHIEYMEQFAKVELFDDAEAVETRVAKRDDVAGLLPVAMIMKSLFKVTKASLLKAYLYYYQHYIK